jgi:putative copper resistance protein D
VTGTLLFRAAVAAPVLRSQEALAKPFWTQTRYVAWISLAVSVVSGLAWLLLLTMSLSGENLGEAVTSGALRDVVNLTQFGRVSQIRLALAIALAISLVLDRSALWRWLGLGAAVGLMGSIAWTGHAASTPHELGYVHLTADALHLFAAAAWIGGLPSLVLLLAAIDKIPALPRSALAHDAARRFSTLGMVGVAILVLSGAVNAWILVGSFHALMTSEYGQLLILKIVVFAVMLAFAAVNRFGLTPRFALLSISPGQSEALRQLRRNSIVEIALGFTVFAIVGMLGIQHPAIHLVQ